MTKKRIHIISFDLPYPPDYGGATDIYHKIRSFHELGIEIILHVFLYKGKIPSPELEALTYKTHYYYRRSWVNPFWGRNPYVVSTRNSQVLLRNLLMDNNPILFEGLHSTSHLNRPELRNRNTVVRAHNIEHNYYKSLGDAERLWIKRAFYYLEAKRLKHYETVLEKASAIAGISPMETKYFHQTYGKASYIPAFHSNVDVVSLVGTGDYILYHGNLSIPENDRAALYLVEKVFPLLKEPCIIAGNNPSNALQKSISKYPHISLKANLTAENIFELMRNAQVNAIITFQSTGIKLKLLNSLYRGRHVVANSEMVKETQLESLCTIADNPIDLANKIRHCYSLAFNQEDINNRKKTLFHTFNNKENALALIALLQATSPSN
ncbi:MAG: glycosyltransferase [Flavobacteriaceae bacterium]|nr:glycosyltransferase [Flavobacteriaceae bacterium]